MPYFEFELFVHKLCSESCLDCISIQWQLETFLNVVKCIFGCTLDITSVDVLLLQDQFDHSTTCQLLGRFETHLIEKKKKSTSKNFI